MKTDEVLNLTAEFKRSLEKACTKLIEPCKTKHVANIVKKSFLDTSNVCYYVAIDLVAKKNSWIIRFKIYYILHTVLQGGFFNNLTFGYIKRSVETMSNPSQLCLIYTDLCKLYQALFFNKCEFFKHYNFLQPNYVEIKGCQRLNFENIQAGISFLKNVYSHYTSHRKLALQIHENVRYKTKFPSACIENQCQLQVAPLLVKDLENIFNLMVKSIRILSAKCNERMLREVVSKFFTPLHKLHLSILDDLRTYSYVTDLYEFQEITDNFVFIAGVTEKTTLPFTEQENEIFFDLTQNQPEDNVAPAKATEDTKIPLNIETQIKMETTNKSIEEMDALINAQMNAKMNAEKLFLEHNTAESESAQSILSCDSTTEETIKRLEEKVSNLTEKLNAAEIKYTSECEKRISEMIDVNNQLRTKLDRERVVAANCDEFRRKYEGIRNLYTELRSQYEELSKSRSHSAAVSNESLLLNEKFTAEIESLKKLLAEKDREIEMLLERIYVLERQSIQTMSNNPFGPKTSSFKQYIEEHSINSKKVLEQVMTAQYLPKTTLVTLIEDIINRIKFIHYEISEYQSNQQSTPQVVALLDQYVPHIISTSLQYLAKNFDHSLETEMNSLKSSYLSIIDEITTNEDNLNYDNVLQRIIDVSTSILSIVNGLPEIKSVQENSEEFDLDRELDGTILNLRKIDKELLQEQAMLRSDNQLDFELQNGVIGSGRNLLELVKRVIENTRTLQKEITHRKNKSTTEAKDFYNKNSDFAQGIIGFAYNIIPSVKELITAMQKYSSGEIFSEELSFHANNVMSLVPRLLICAKAKADLDSKAFPELRDNATLLRFTVKQTTDALISNMNKNISTIDIDFSSVSQRKLMILEKECRIRISELEKKLAVEHKNLGKINAAGYVKDDKN